MTFYFPCLILDFDLVLAKNNINYLPSKKQKLSLCHDYANKISISVFLFLLTQTRIERKFFDKNVSHLSYLSLTVILKMYIREVCFKFLTDNE